MMSIPAIRILLAPSADLARSLPVPDLTVEAEYGSFVLEGSLYTAAHHQPIGSRYAGRHIGGAMSSPCNDSNIPVVVESGGTVVVSHVDLDTFGGCLRAMGVDIFDGAGSVWESAELVDCNGAHKLQVLEISLEDQLKLQAFWAWSRTNIPRGFSRTEVTDITTHVIAAGEALEAILMEDPKLLQVGMDAVKEEATLNASSFQENRGGVIVRQSDQFVNHLYFSPAGERGKAVVTRNTKTGSITVSLYDPISGFSCRDFVQSLWGSEAGGHAGIAGSPREASYTVEDLSEVTTKLIEALAALPA